MTRLKLSENKAIYLGRVSKIACFFKLAWINRVLKILKLSWCILSANDCDYPLIKFQCLIQNIS